MISSIKKNGACKLQCNIAIRHLNEGDNDDNICGGRNTLYTIPSRPPGIIKWQELEKVPSFLYPDLPDGEAHTDPEAFCQVLSALLTSHR